MQYYGEWRMDDPILPRLTVVCLGTGRAGLVFLGPAVTAADLDMAQGGIGRLTRMQTWRSWVFERQLWCAHRRPQVTVAQLSPF